MRLRCLAFSEAGLAAASYGRVVELYPGVRHSACERIAYSRKATWIDRHAVALSSRPDLNLIRNKSTWQNVIRQNVRRNVMAARGLKNLEVANDHSVSVHPVM